jgi:SAM-dependent methyltransferase
MDSRSKKRTFCFDIDGTLCDNTWGEYEKAEPIQDMIVQVNGLYDAGHTVILFTARGGTTGVDWRPLTEAQMVLWGVRYHTLQFGKPQADVYIDDRAMSLEEWGRKPPPEVAAALSRGAGPVLGGARVESVFGDDKYLSVVYSEQRRPKTDYPAQLAAYLRDHVYRGTGRLIDVGCGRGDLMRAFCDAGFSVAGTDLSPISIEMCKPHPVKISDLEQDALPFAEGSFDFVFSKSVIEHLHKPMIFLKQALRLLSPAGTAVIMTPSWTHTAWGPFYLDHTHVKPFTAPSLRDAMLMAGFEDVRVVHFHQLPFLWRHPYLTPLVRVVAQLPVPYSPMNDVNLPRALNTLIRFSKEVMLMGVGRKAPGAGL